MEAEKKSCEIRIAQCLLEAQEQAEQTQERFCHQQVITSMKAIIADAKKKAGNLMMHGDDGEV